MQDKLNQAIAYRNEEKFDEAEKLFLELVAQYPDSAEVEYHFAWLCDKRGLETAAVPHYERAIALGLTGEDLRGALLGLGSTYRTIGQYPQAVATLQRGMETFPDSKEFPTFLAMALYNTGEYKQAVSLLLKTLVETSDNEGIQRFSRAILFYADELDTIWR
jgi:tetratricopeptide (TPR) repeat protein